MSTLGTLKIRDEVETERGFLISTPIRLSSSTNKYHIWSIVALEIFHFTFTSTNYLPNSINPVLRFDALQVPEISQVEEFSKEMKCKNIWNKSNWEEKER